MKGPVSDNQDIVTLVLSMRQSGASTTTIAEALADQGIVIAPASVLIILKKHSDYVPLRTKRTPQIKPKTGRFAKSSYWSR